MDVKQRVAAKKFVEDWTGKGYEKGESQKFWIQLLRDVLGVEHPEQFISFEDKVHLDHTSFIDARIPATKVLIEQKSFDKDLYKAIKQSDGSLLNPFQQAKRYITELPLSQHPRWVVTCNFQKFCVYDMERPNGEPQEILLKDLEKEYYRLSFLVDTGSEHLKKEMEISIKAGEIVGLLYDALLKQYKDCNNEESLKSLNILCVRLVFCLYAEDAGIFGKHDIFLDYLRQYDVSKMRKALIELFAVLNTKPEDRDPYLEDDLKEFPYVNGGLFADEHIEIPQFTDEIRTLLLEKASANFDWSEISPTIFGAVFESTLNPETRRKGGMHYTSIENIHKVIDPLFMDELRNDFEAIKIEKNPSSKTKQLKAFQERLASLNFLDPACGSGNFLTETYISLRKLENEVLENLYSKHGALQGKLGFEGELNPIKVSIRQFYGIEINDFAVTVAKTALWIAESQMMKKTEDIVHMNLDFLPLKTYANIVEGNALQINWEDIISKESLNYIIGNPPFVGQSVRTKTQANDMNLIFGKGEIETKLDYVACWYKKACTVMKNTKIKAALVSTNSICQGESVPTFWKHLIKDGLEIQFAHTSFVWDSEAIQKAHVHCVIVGFSLYHSNNDKFLYSEDRLLKTKHINPYLYPANDIWITNRTNISPNNMPKMTTGSPPTDDGGLTLTKDEKNFLENKYPVLQKYIKPFIGAREFLHDKNSEFSRYCLWLKNASPNEYANIKEIQSRLERVKKLRLSSNADRIIKMADYPYLFCQIRQPENNYLVLPRHSSEKRKYIPIGFISPNVIVGDACTILPNATLYIFGILTSNVHMAWMRVVCGRLEMRYRYSPSVYNNFPWCSISDKQKEKIEKTAQGILDARALYPDCSLADLYDELTMPPELRKAHQENDKAVMEAYGFCIKDEQTGKYRWLTEYETVARLMQMYQELTK